MTTSIYFVEEIKTKKTIARDLQSVGEAIQFIKKLGRSISEFRIQQKVSSFTKSISNKHLLISGCDDDDIEMILETGLIPIYNNPSQIDECDKTIVLSENKVLVGTLKFKEKYSSEGASKWSGYFGRKGFNSWNTSLFFDKSIQVFDRNEFEKNNFKLRGNQGGVSYKKSKLNLDF